MNTSGQYIRAKDICKHFGISNPTLYRWIKSGKLPTPSYINNQRIWKKSAIHEAEALMVQDSISIKGGWNQ